MRYYVATFVLLAMIAVSVGWLASNHPEHWWQQPVEVEQQPQPEPLPGLVHVYEGSFDNLASWQSEMNRLHDAGYTTRACSGGINGRMCVMEMEK